MRKSAAVIAPFIGILIYLSACSSEMPKASPPTTPLPEFVDVKTLATRPDVVAIVIGTVVQDLGEVKAPRGEIYHRWEMVVEQYVIGEGPDHITVRITQAVQPGNGSPIPTKESRLAVDEHVLLFLSKAEGGTSLKPSEFTILGPLTGKYIIENGSVRAADWPTAPLMPLNELIAQIKAAREHEDR